MKQKEAACCGALARLPSRSVQGSLELFCSTFLFQDKKVEICIKMNDEKNSDSHSNASPGSA
jgi:hypothetical protein